jgi:hypothetical protein
MILQAIRLQEHPFDTPSQMARRASFRYSKPNGSKSILSILQAKWLEEHPFDISEQVQKSIFLNQSNARMQRGGELPLPSSQGSCASYLKQASGLGSRVSERAGVGGLRRAGWASGPWERAGRRGGDRRAGWASGGPGGRRPGGA